MNLESLLAELQPLYDGSETLVGRLAGVSATALALALSFHVLKLAARARAWQNIVRATYPTEPLRFRTALGAFLVGVGVDAFVPARAGELLRLGLVRRRLPGSTLPGLASTLLAESAFNTGLAAIVIAGAIAFGFGFGLPATTVGADQLTQHPLIVSAVVAGLVVVVGGLAVRVRSRARWLASELRRGLAIFDSPPAYLRTVVSWQILAWGLRLASVYWFLSAFHLPANLPAALLVVVIQLVAASIPLTPGGAGTQQAMLVGALSTTAAATVLGFGIGMQAATALADVVLAAGALVAMTGSFRWRTLAAGRDPAPAALQPAS